tara:strand:- start:7478 stop:7687 length:210 start_codon:yes stop_codon:yes gene_type:complete
MRLNTFLLLLLVVAAYTNLYLTIKKAKKRVNRRNVELKEWEGVESGSRSYSMTNKKFKEWINNTKSLDK